MQPTQPDLELPFPELAADQPPIPVRMLNEHVYCPRLAYLMWVQGEWMNSADTIEGRHRHRRVDKPAGHLPPAEKAEAERIEIHARSITLSSNKLGLVELPAPAGTPVAPVQPLPDGRTARLSRLHHPLKRRSL
jgi:CRISPR-associated protein Cas1